MPMGSTPDGNKLNRAGMKSEAVTITLSLSLSLSLSDSVKHVVGMEFARGKWVLVSPAAASDVLPAWQFQLQVRPRRQKGTWTCDQGQMDGAGT